VSTPNILAWKSKEVPLPCCKTGAESEVFSPRGPLVRGITCHCTFKYKQEYTEWPWKYTKPSPSLRYINQPYWLMSIANNKSEITNETHDEVE
jgi:hypothetical protein